MRKLLKIILLINLGLLTLNLAGCEPPEPVMFGVPQPQWNALTKEQQNEVIRGYNERQTIAKQNEPMLQAVSAAQTVISQEQANRAAERRSQPPSPWPPRPTPFPRSPEF